MSRIRWEGVPPRRGSRGYCLVADGKHYPPKYTIALAHGIATDEFLSSDRFSGGTESNEFLRNLGFHVVECTCGGARHDHHPTQANVLSVQKRRSVSPKLHSERCPECKIRMRELLERLYGTCLTEHRFPWRTRLAAYRGTQIEPTLRNVATALKAHRRFGIGDFVRSEVLAACDFWVPNPGFIVEFDESQHFTTPRKLALSEYPAKRPLGFSTERWMALCENHDARDNDPPYRDEQRAWYDTLRDLVPTLKGLQPTVRLYARDRVWCSMDPDNTDDLETISELIGHRKPGSTRTPPTRTQARSPARRTQSTLCVAMVFPEVPPEPRKPDLPTASQFAGEPVDIVLFPEGYIRRDDNGRIEALRQLSLELKAVLLVGVVEQDAVIRGRRSQVILRFNPDGSEPLRFYVKHSTAEAVAFEDPNWHPDEALPTIELSGARVGATICHDHYLGLLPRRLARCGAQLWVNPSFISVMDIKWSSILRLRAVENRTFAFCTLHRKPNRRTHPFAFSPHGNELSARRPGSCEEQPLSQCVEAGNIYIVHLDMNEAAAPLDWSSLPPAAKPKRARNGHLQKPIHVALNRLHPSVRGRTRWESVPNSGRVETISGSVFVGVVPGARILDAADCFRVINQAKQMGCAPIIWNHWEQLPTDSCRLASLMMGRSIECCAPVILSDRDGIHELVELSNDNKIPTRRTMDASRKWIVDIKRARGLDSAFKLVSKRLPQDMRTVALERYRSLM